MRIKLRTFVFRSGLSCWETELTKLLYCFLVLAVTHDALVRLGYESKHHVFLIDIAFADFQGTHFAAKRNEAD